MKEEETGKFTRRAFLKTAGSALAVTGMASGDLVLGSKETGAAVFPDKRDEEADVLVVGSGFAGWQPPLR